MAQAEQSDRRADREMFHLGAQPRQRRYLMHTLQAGEL
jgi:hypothetical protein